MSSESDFPWEAVAPDEAVTPGDEHLGDAEEVPKPPRAPRKAAPRKAAPRKAAPRKAAPRKAALPPAEVPMQPTSYEILREALVPETTVLPAKKGPSKAARAVALSGMALLLAGAAGFGAAAWNESQPSRYRSSAQLLIDQEPALTFSKDDGLVAKLGVLRFKYADLLTSTSFASQVAGLLAEKPATVHSALSAQTPFQSLLITVSATSTNPLLPQRIAQTAATTLSSDLAAVQVSEKIPQAFRVTLRVVSPAEPAVRVSPSRRRSLELGGGSFAAVLLGLALLRDLTRRRPAPVGLGA
jgi:capsular polysaccharide biosynthesis protein